MNLSVEHVLMIVLVAFALHYLMQNCGCRQVEGVSGAWDDFWKWYDKPHTPRARRKLCEKHPEWIVDGVCLIPPEYLP